MVFWTIDSRLEDDLATAGFDFYYTRGMSLMDSDAGSSSSTTNGTAKSVTARKDTERNYVVDQPLGISLRKVWD